MLNIEKELLTTATRVLPSPYAVRDGAVPRIWINTAAGYEQTVCNIKNWLPKAAEFVCGIGANSVDVQSALENYLPFTEVTILDDFWFYPVNSLRGHIMKTGHNIDTAQYMVYIPYVTNIELLRKAVLSANAMDRNVWVIDSSPAGLSSSIDWLQPCTILRLPYDTTFTQMHNTVIKRAINKGLTHIVFMHSDAELLDNNVIPELLDSMAHDIAVAFTNYDALACFNIAAVRDIGFWDETFPQYASDCDYFYRVKLSKWRTAQTELGSRVAHFTSVVIKSGDTLRLSWNTSWVLAHYAHKWGGAPSSEQFVLPYGIRSSEL
jgi:hypothetical protein